MKHVFISALIVCCAFSAVGQVAQSPTMTADEVMAKVFLRDREREKVSQGYEGRRLYVLDNEKWHRHAELLVAVKADADGTKSFEVLNEEGWKSANKHVLRKMLESEMETSRAAVRPKTQLTPENYSFSLQGSSLDVVAGRPTYVIGVVPKRADKYLFKGRIWVDACDYAVVRSEGNPAQNPSFWTRNIHFVQQYQKMAQFWFPHMTESVTDARMFGKTDVVIHYFDYVPNSFAKRHPATPQNAALHDANYVSLP